MDARTRRVADNETLFREVNERVKDVNLELAADEPADFLCECGRIDCTRPVSLTLAEYEGVRKDPTHFAVALGHEFPEIERVVSQNERFAVVEKVAPAAAKIAEERDPRS